MESPDYFKALDFVMPPFSNPPDQYMKILSTADLKKMERNNRKTKFLKDEYHERTGQFIDKEISEFIIHEMPESKEIEAPFPVQLKCLI